MSNLPKKTISKWVKIGEASGKLGVSIDTLRRWEKTGKIEVIRTLGGTRLYSTSALNDLTKTPLKYQRQNSNLPPSARLASGGQTRTSKSSFKSPTSNIKQLSTVEELIQHLEGGVAPAAHLPGGDQFIDEREIEPEELSVYAEAELPEELSVVSHQSSDKSSFISHPELTRSHPELVSGSNNEMPKRVRHDTYWHKMPLFIASSGVFACLIITSLILARVNNFNGLFNLSSQKTEKVANIQEFKSQSDVLSAETAGYYLNIKSDVVIEENLAVGGSINELTLTPNTDGFSIAGGTSASRKLTVLNGDVTLDQDVSTKGSPSFVALKLPAASNQISMGGAGTLTWTPTGTQTITLPNATGTVLLDSATQTITNKSLSGSSNTFTSIPNSALSNSKVTVTAGTNLSGGGDVSLGSSVTLNLSSTPEITNLKLTQATAPTTSTDKLYNVSGTLYWAGSQLSSSGGVLPTGTNGQTLYHNSTAWTATSNLYHNGTNVGIGITAPLALFDVSGTARVTTLNATSALQLNGTSINTGGTLTNVAYLDTANIFTANQNFNLGFDTDDAFVVADGGALTTSQLATFNGNVFFGGSTGILQSNGNVGIGTTVPASKLHVEGSLFPVLQTVRTTSLIGTGNIVGTSNGQGLANSYSLTTQSSGDMVDGFGGGLLFYLADDTYNNTPTNAQARIYAQRDGSDTAGALSFFTNSSDTSSKMVIRSSGNVGIGGIGAGGPYDQLEVNGTGILRLANATAPKLRFDRGGNTAWELGNNTGKLQIGYSTAGNFSSLTTAVTFQNDGNVGIGITGPGTNLEVYATSNAQLRINSTDSQYVSFADSGTVRWYLGSNNTYGTDGLGLTVDGASYLFGINPSGGVTVGGSDLASSTYKLYVNGAALTTGNTYLAATSGNVGIGATSPLSKLGVLGNAAIGATYGAFAAPTSGLLVEGNVGVGTTSPLANLHVVGQCVAKGTRIRRRRKNRRHPELVSGSGDPDDKMLKLVQHDNGGNDNGENGWIEEDIFVEEIKPGDEVLSLNDKTGKWEWHKVEATLDKGIQTVYRLETETGKWIETTSEHPYLIKNSHQKTASTAVLVSQTSLLNDWIDTLESSIQQNPDFVKPDIMGVDLPGVEPGRLGVSTQSSKPAKPTPNVLSQNANLFSIEWIKVSQLKSGMEIATLEGWEKIINISKTGRKQMYDLQIEDTHNFVGNNIVAHNTILQGLGTTTGLNFRVQDSGGADKFTILDNGNVGIGTTNPLNTLHVSGGMTMRESGTSSEVSQIGYYGNGSNYRFLLRDLSQSGNNWLGFNTDGSASRFYTASGNYAFITNTGTTGVNLGVGGNNSYFNSGNLGIGSANTPGSKLSISGALAIGSSYFGTTAPSNGAIIQGNVGVGTTAPLANLHVVGQCVTGDTKLKRRKRRKGKNGEWIDEWEDVEIKDIKEGDGILTLDEKSGKFIVSKIKALQDMGIHQTYLLITDSGKTIRTTANHPYFIRPSQNPTIIGGTFEVDQSNRIEELNKDTFVAITSIVNNNFRFSIKLSKTVKKVLRQIYKEEGRLNLFAPNLFAFAIATLAKSVDLKPDRLIIDQEYPGSEKQIRQLLHFFLPQASLEFKSIGKHSPAHLIAYGAHLGKVKVNTEAKLEDLYPKKKDRSTLGVGQGVVTHQDTHILGKVLDDSQHMRSLTGLDYHNKLDLSRGKWLKVYDLKPGMDIATLDGWEKIVAVKEFTREQVFDIEVSGTHNFVGNNIVAHNTILQGLGTTTGLNFRVQDSSGADKFTILDNGNVGIGTTSPSQKLEVVGNIRATSTGQFGTVGGGGAGVVQVLGTGKTQITLDGSGTHYGGIENTASETWSLNYNTTGGTALGTAVLTWTGTGNVGIGITSPAEILDVNGRVRLAQTTAPASTTDKLYNVTGNLFWNGTNLTGGGALPSGTVTGQTLYWNSTAWNTSNNLFNDNTNVGIGTTSPAAKLNIVSTSTTGSDFTLTNTGIVTGTVASYVADSLTSGTLMDFSADGLTTGKIMNLASTSTVLSTGGLLSLDWSPTGSTTIYATGDLFSINAGQYGSVGNLLNLKDNGSSVFSVSQSAVTTSLPTNFTSPGDVSLAYDLNFTNPTASYIKSEAPLYLTAGESFNSSNLTLTTYHEGSIILASDNQPTTAATAYSVQLLPNLSSSTNSLTYTGEYSLYNVPEVNLTGTSGTVTSVFNSYAGLTATAGTVTNWYGYYAASPTGSGTVTNKYAFVSESGAGNVGIGTTAPSALLDVSGTARVTTLNATSALQLNGTSINTGGTLTNVAYLDQANAFTANQNFNLGFDVDDAFVVADGGALTTSQQAIFNGNLLFGTSTGILASGGNVGIGTTSPSALFSVGSTSQFQVNSSGAIAASTGITTSGGYTQSGTTANTFTGTSTFSNATYSALFTGGNVGIGTTSPVTLLDVNSKFNVANTGYIGIGTTAPSNLLAINGGNVSITDNSLTTGTGADGACSVTDGTITLDAASSNSCAGRGTADAVSYNIATSVSAGATSIDVGATPTGIAANDEILIINLRGTSTDYANVGKYETAIVSSVSSNTLNLDRSLRNSYDGTTQKIMVQRIPQYTTVTVGDTTGSAGSAVLTVGAYNNTNGKGGVIFFRATGAVTINSDGKVDGAGKGYVGGTGTSPASGGSTYNGTGGTGGGDGNNGSSGQGGGGGMARNASTGGSGTVGGAGGGGGFFTGGGGGGGYGTVGTATGTASSGSGTTGGNGGNNNSPAYGDSGGGGGTYGSANLSQIYFGSGGGGGSDGNTYSANGGDGGRGGGIIYITGSSVTVTGTISANGANGNDSAGGSNRGGGGGGAGGSVLIKATTQALGSSLVTASGGTGGTGGSTVGKDGGAGGVGRIRLDSNTSTGTTSPTVGYTANFSTPSLLVNRSSSIGDILGLQYAGTDKFRIDNSGNLISAVGAKWMPITDSNSALNIANSSGTSFVTFDTSGGNVGIGTTAPSSALSVAGGYTQSGTTANTFTGTSTFSNATYSALFTGGNVGIGTVAPLAKLGVLGNASIGATYGAVAAPVSGLIIEGNVGIGTTSPAYKLDITTSTASDRGINIANTAATGTNYGIYSSVTGAATANIGGYFAATGATTSRGLEVATMTSATSTGLTIGALSGTTADTGINIGAISGTGATGTGITIGNISTTGTTNYGLQLGTMTGGTTSNYQISTGVLTSATTTTNAQLNLGGVVTTGGTTNYGINVGALSGTGTTNYGVNVNTLTSVGTTNYGLNIGGATGAATTNYGLLIGAVSGATTNYGLYTTSGTTVLNATSGNVGIGTTSPLGLLHVAGQCVTGDTLLKRRRRKKKRHSGGEGTEPIESDDEILSSLRSSRMTENDGLPRETEGEVWEDVRIDEIKPGDEILTLDESTGKFVTSKIKALQKMGMQDVYQLITNLGKKIRTTGNHPYLAKKPAIFGPSGTFEADQSNRIEDLTKDSFIALSNVATGESFIASISKEEKRKAFKHYQKESRFFGPILWARMIAYLIREYSIHNSKMILDKEYPGYEKIIDQIIEGNEERIFTEYQSIGHKSKAHYAAYGKAYFAHKKATGALTQYVQVAEDVLHTKTSLAIRTPSSRSDNLYHKIDHLSTQSIKQADWIKVYNLELGWDIATLDGWEKIISLKKVAREQVFDIEVENTHNFVGNNIVAHNTAIFGVGEGSTPTVTTLRGAAGAGTDIAGANFTFDASLGTGTGGSGALIFRTAPTAASSSTANTLAEIMRITPGGNVGIGTTSPLQKLDLATGSSYGIAGTSVLSVTTLGTGVLTSSLTTVGALASGSIASGFGTISTGNTITTTGTMGTAATTAFTGLTGIFSTSVTSPLILGGTSTTSDLTLQTTSGVGTTGADMHFLVGNNGATEAMTILNNGSVGIGTTSPGAKLNVVGQGKFTSGLFLQGSIEFNGVTDSIISNGNVKIGPAGGGSTTFSAGGNITSTGTLTVQGTGNSSIAGNVGIGDASPASMFVVGDGDLFQVDSSGRAFLPSGALGAGTLSLAFTGDTNTGIYNTAADKLGLVAGGTESMTITNGNVGIGTTGPTSALTIQAAANSGLNLRQGTVTDRFRLFVGDGTSGGVGFTTTADENYIWSVNAGLHFRAASNGSLETMTILNNGNIGIGTTGPVAHLQLERSSQPYMDIVDTDNGTLQFGMNGGTGAIIAVDNGSISFNTGSTYNAFPAGTARLVIGSTGNIYGSTSFDFGTSGDTDLLQLSANQLVVNGAVGIGIAPTFRLGIHTVGTGNNYAHFTNTDTGTGSGNGSLVGIDGDESLTFWQYENNFIKFGTNNTEQVRIDGSGNVGIGTVSPLAKLHVAGQCVTSNTLLPIKRRKKKTRRRQSYGGQGRGEEDEWEDLLTPIKDVQQGDLVASLDEQSGEIVYKEIKKLLNKGFQKVVKITTKDGRSIETTTNHPYLTVSRGNSQISQTREILTWPNREMEWTKVSELKVGDRIAVPKRKTSKVIFEEIVSIEDSGRKLVYDIEVEGTHNFVGGHYINRKTGKALTQKQEEAYCQYLTIKKALIAEGSFVSVEASNVEIQSGLSPFGTSIISQNSDIFGEGVNENDIVYGGIVAHNTAIFGAGEGSTPTVTTLRGAAGAGTDIAGANFTFDASNGTGTGGSGALIFRTAPVAASSSTANTLAEIMRITPGGNVGIGTTAPSALFSVGTTSQFQVNSSGNVTFASTLTPTANFTLGSASYTGTLTTSDWGISSVGALTGITGITNDGAYTQTGSSVNTFTGNVLFGGSTGILQSNGNVGIGTTAPGALLEIGGASSIISNTSGDITITPNANTIFSSGNVGIGTTAPTAQLELSTAVAIKSAGTAWDNPSDIRLKNVVGNYVSGLDQILQINPVKFTFKEDNALGIKDAGEHIGIIAQDIQGVFPEAVSVGKQGYLTFNIDPILWASVNAIKELSLKQTELNDSIALMQNSYQIDSNGDLVVSGIKTSKIIISADVPVNNISTPGVDLTAVLTNTDLRLKNLEESVTLSLSSVIASAAWQSAAIEKIATDSASLQGDILGLNSSIASMSARLDATIESQRAQIAELQLSVISSQSSATSSSVISEPVNRQLTNQILTTENGNPTTDIATSSATPSATITPEQTSSASATPGVSTGSPGVNELNLTPPEILLATQSAHLVDLTVASDATISGKLVAYDLSVQNIFKSLGDAFLGNTTVAGNFSVDGTMSITGDSLNSLACNSERLGITQNTGNSDNLTTRNSDSSGSQSLSESFRNDCGTLFLQNSPLAQGVDFFNGQVTIDKTGKLVVQEIEAKTVTTEKLIIGSSRPGSNNNSSSTEVSSGEASLGTAIIPTGQTEIPVFTTAVTDKSKVFLTPTSPTGGQAIILGEIVPNTGFVASLDHIYTADIKFNWFIIDQQ